MSEFLRFLFVRFYLKGRKIIKIGDNEILLNVFG